MGVTAASAVATACGRWLGPARIKSWSSGVCKPRDPAPELPDAFHLFARNRGAFDREPILEQVSARLLTPFFSEPASDAPPHTVPFGNAP